MEVNIAGWSQDDRNWPESDVYFRGDGGDDGGDIDFYKSTFPGAGR